MLKLVSVSSIYSSDEDKLIAYWVGELLREPMKETSRTVYSENELTGSRKKNNLQEPKTSGKINRNQNTEGENNEMPRPRKTPAAAAAPAPTQQPAANMFGAAPGGTPPNPMFGGAGQSPAPTPTTFGGAPVQQPAAPAANPAGGMFGAAAAAHPTQNPAAPAASVDLTPVLKAIEDLKKEVLQQVNAGLQDIRSVHTRLQTIEGKLGTPQAQSAATQTAPAQPSPPVQAATATQANSFPPDQVAHVVGYIRQGLQGHYASGGVSINVNNPEHQTMLTNAAVSAGAPYLQGADATNEQLKQHIVQSLQAAGAVDPQGNVVA